jgi:hypothetical protein
MTCIDIRKECIKARGKCPSPTTVYCSEQISHTNVLSSTRDAKGNKTIHCITHHDPYDNAIAIDECHFEAPTMFRG